MRIFDDLKRDDILFFDGSHRVLQNSDNQVLFFEVIPRLNENVIVHIHDINWPHDYPDEWCNRFYNEQYILGSMLLYAPEMFEVIFPAAYVSMHIDYKHLFEKIWKRKG